MPLDAIVMAITSMGQMIKSLEAHFLEGRLTHRITFRLLSVYEKPCHVFPNDLSILIIDYMHALGVSHPLTRGGI